MEDYLYSLESIEEISFLLDFLDREKPWSSNFFTECKRQLSYRHYLSRRQLECIIAATERHAIAINSNIGLYIGFTELQKKLVILNHYADSNELNKFEASS